MIRVNLLPHREVRRKANQRQFFVLAGIVAGIGVLAWYMVHTVLDNQIETQQGRNKYLEGEIVKLDKQIEEIKKLKDQTQQLLQRKKVVEALQGNRSEAVHLLDQLVRQLPEGVYLKSVKQTGQKVNITGYAQSNARVSTLMRNLESSPWLSSPSLVEIKSATQSNLRLSEFSLNVTLTQSKTEPQGQGGKPAAKTGALHTVPSPLAAAAPALPNAPDTPAAAAAGGALGAVSL
ncbi:MAG TPA: PilN domain-containing protein [Burkholderiales bacterium]|nr:PilN domain-containing protein [Burkholderiales bacterium]